MEKCLYKYYFKDTKRIERPFSIFGFVDNGTKYGVGWDAVNAENVCGFSKIRLDNIYAESIKQHFDCGYNISQASPLQIALRAIVGLRISELTEKEKEHAAKAIESGYVYREGDILYTKVLVNSMESNDKLFEISSRLNEGYFEEEAQLVAEKLVKIIKKNVPYYLLDEWRFVNTLASLPVFDSVVDVLVEKGVLVSPENGFGAEGCWLSVMK